MINLFFKKKANECNVEMEVKGVDECTIKKEADSYATRQYNSKVIEKIKEDLLSKYKIDASMFMSMHMSFYKENLLVDAIINDMADSLGLLKEVKDD